MYAFGIPELEIIAAVAGMLTLVVGLIAVGVWLGMKWSSRSQRHQ